MTILDLVNPENSEIIYELSNFPDGQKQIKIIKRDDYYVKIKSRLNNFSDLEKIICAVMSLRNIHTKEIELYIPYFLGSRSDRKFELGSNNYLKQVICPIINSLNFSKVTVMDPHSDVLEACINNFESVNNYNLIDFVLKDIGDNNIQLISPDAGAFKKIFKVADYINYTDEIVTCTKFRDEEGNLTNISVPLYVHHMEKRFIIVDDICDGGRTFINIAKEIKKLFPENEIYLIVTHGIFSAGFKELNKYFTRMYCTNSYRNIGDLEGNNLEKTNVKQLNIF